LGSAARLQKALIPPITMPTILPVFRPSSLFAEEDAVAVVGEEDVEVEKGVVEFGKEADVRIEERDAVTVENVDAVTVDNCDREGVGNRDAEFVVELKAGMCQFVHTLSWD
jgi:hypothetical protein